MGYTKLFSEIVMSTVWREKDTTRLVWITMLALRNRHHVVEGSIPGLADCARVSIKACRVALKVLSEPDPDSRSQEQQGRRIEQVDGGWFIINGEKYRRKMSEDERREKNAIYQKNHRERKKSVSAQSDKSAKSAQTEEETETKKNKEGANGSRPQSVEDLGADTESTESRSRNRERQGGTPAASTISVEDWLKELEADKTYQGIDVRREYGKMLNWCKVKRKQPTQRRFVNWLNGAEKPLPAQHSARPDYKRNYLPPARELSDEEFEAQRKIALAETKRAKEAIRNV